MKAPFSGGHRPLQVHQEVELVIENLAFGGEGVSHLQGFTVFVPGALPGEKVSAVARVVKDRWARADLKAVLIPSPDRIAPPCPIFHECGGCQWQHLDYSRQLVSKRKAVADAMERIGKLPQVPIQPCLPSPSPYGYRNKALPVMSMRGGHFVAGIYEPRSHHLVPYVTCPIQADPVNHVIQRVLLKAEQAGLTPYQPKSHTGFLRNLVVRHGQGTGEMLLAFVTREVFPTDHLTRPTVVPEPPERILSRIAAELTAEVPALAGVLQNINPARTTIVLGNETRVLAGQDHFRETFDNLQLRVSLNSFLQVNTGQAAILHAVVREALGYPEGRSRWDTVLDLYSGIGTLALAVSESADYVLGVEEIEAAVLDARGNAALNHRKHVDFMAGDSAETLLKLREKGLLRLDAAILDPPRKGVPPELLARLTGLHPERLVYVSCDPATLSRDLALLVQHGYSVDWVQPLDMFPQTYHVECVARLTRTMPLPGEWVAGAGHPQRAFRLPNESQASKGLEAPSGRMRISFLRNFRESAREAVRSVSDLMRTRSIPAPVPDGAKPPASPCPGIQAPSPARTFDRRLPVRFLGYRPVRITLALLLFLTAGFVVRATFLPGKGSGVFSARTTPDLVAELPSGTVKRYEALPFVLKLGKDAQITSSQVRARAVVYRSGVPVETLGHIQSVALKPDPSGKFLRGFWPVPYNALPGTYAVRLSVISPGLNEPQSFESAFTLQPVTPHLLPPGFTAITLEGGNKTGPGGRFPPLDGQGEPSTRHAAAWAKFLGANAFIYLAAQTSVWTKPTSKVFPFSPYMLELSGRYAKAAHAAGLQYGVYITTFRVIGEAWRKAPYKFAFGYSQDQDKLTTMDFVSLKDESRREHLVEILKKFANDDAVDFVGFDYIRTGEGAYELAGDFMSGLGLEAPEGFAAWKEEDQALWLARRIERDKDQDLKHLFEWWRAHTVALALKDMLARSRMAKPVFTFTLGWQMGHQHGQDPAMFVDAGVGFNNIMLYQRNAPQVEEMKQHWPPYLARGNAMYVLGEMADYNWVQQSLFPPAPEELCRRECETFENWFPLNASLGMYWHDLYRIFYGAKGPYSSMEWAMSAGRAFTFLRQAENVTPILTRMEVPQEVPAGVPFTYSVEVLNRSNEDLKNLFLVQMDTGLDCYSETARVGPFDLPAGNRTRVSNLTAVTPKESHPERDNRWMEAVLVEKAGRRSVRAFDFTYVKALTSDELKERLDVVNKFKERSKEEEVLTPVVDPPSVDKKLRAEKRLAERTHRRLQEEAEKLSDARSDAATVHPVPDKAGPPDAEPATPEPPAQATPTSEITPVSTP